MKVIPFPSGGAERPDEAWLTELEAALDGTAEGPRADSWRELRGEVRALAPPMSPEFERELGERIAERSARSAPRRFALDGFAISRSALEGFAPGRSASKGSTPKQPRRRLGWSRRPSRPALAGISVACAVIAAVLIAAPWRPAGHLVESSPRSPSIAAHADNAGRASAGRASGAVASAPAVVAKADRALAPEDLGPSGAPAAAPGRVQQLGASIRLAATPSEVQSTADRVSRLAVSEGGFVQSSHVDQGEGTGEANLTLSLPSAKLSAALASLGALAPVRAESQTLQDITNTYDAARQRLSDATAERQALLRALAKASTEGEIDSLRERLAENRGALAQARSGLRAISQRASTSEVEVTVIGDRSVGSEGLTLNRGLHDAGRVLVVTLAVLLIAAAVLVPLALAIFALVTGRRAWRRHQRERVLDAR
jgi:hypothetical protein